jgi:protein-tyrosine phosphatase
VTKPAKIAAGIGVAALGCGLVALVTSGIVRVAAVWTTVACVIACVAYVRNRPAWLGKQDGRLGPRAILVLPYLVAFRIACAIMRRARPADGPTQVAPGVWVGGRVAAASLPPHTGYVVDLVAEYPADPAVRALRGYRSLPVLDGGYPASMPAFLSMMAELARARDGAVVVHCDSGRGRAPTIAAALLVARGLVPDVRAALDAIRAVRPVVAPTRSDRAFLARVEPELQRLARETSPSARPAARLD